MRHTPRCARCNALCSRNERHDAYFCAACDEWLESVCDDADCEFCAGRPEKPSQVVVDGSEE
jgi:hypothetical protein